ncbi:MULTISPECIES: RidA family protein [Sphingosinicellaceae]|uniref:RidA family protein n=1 Tax=Sphingosinicellaceae TaxID=2820280 RepID=UPI001C1DFBB9|nr:MULTISPECIES: RidA family protein [Polymorphobacter]QYE34513.1 RidA family protein [Polymorphobacter sp. PAMC 29334]UAJ09694.1 RidA family protein [Polymorphobacter megasporae]
MIRTMTALLGASLLATAANAEAIKHANTPPGLILESVTVTPGTEMLYLSGQVASPVDMSKPMSAMASMSMADFGDTKTQTISVLGKIKKILASHGYTMADIIKLTVFVAAAPDMGGKMDFAGMNDGFKTFFGTSENPGTVARSTVQVAALAGPAFLVEIEATAAKPAK